MWLNQDSLGRSLTLAASTPEVRIHIYLSISISRTTQKYSTPNQGENSQKHFYFPLWNKCSSYLGYYHLLYYFRKWVLWKKSEYEEIKGASARNLERKEKVRREVKIDKCPTVELGVQDTHLREKKKKERKKEKKKEGKYRASYSPQKVSKEQERYVSPQKSTSRIRVSPLLSPSYTIHSPHMHILIWLIDLFF